jgi:hypothetical protein
MVRADKLGEVRVFLIELGSFGCFEGDAGCLAAREAIKSLCGCAIDEAPRWSFSLAGKDKATAAGIMRGSRDATRIVQTRCRVSPAEERQGDRNRVFIVVVPGGDRSVRFHQAWLPLARIVNAARGTA